MTAVRCPGIPLLGTAKRMYFKANVASNEMRIFRLRRLREGETAEQAGGH